MDDPEKQEGFKKGHLFKKGGLVMSSWSRRFCVVKPRFFLYYKSSKDKRPKGEILLERAHVLPLEVVKGRISFSIVTPVQKVYLAAETEKERDEWMNAIKRSIPERLQKSKSTSDVLGDPDPKRNEQTDRQKWGDSFKHRIAARHLAAGPKFSDQKISDQQTITKPVPVRIPVSCVGDLLQDKQTRKWLTHANLPMDKMEKELHLLLEIINFVSTSKKFYLVKKKPLAGTVEVVEQEVKAKAVDKLDKPPKTERENDQISASAVKEKPKETKIIDEGNNAENNDQENQGNQDQNRNEEKQEKELEKAVPKEKDPELKKLTFPIPSLSEQQNILSQGDVKKIFKNQEAAGSGGFGVVLRAEVANDKQKPKLPHVVAIKKMPHGSIKDQSHNFKEIFFLRKFDHPNIVKYYRTYLCGPDELWVIMEYMEGGTLTQARKSYTFNEENIAYVARELLQGLNYLHEMKHAHRDVKSSNVMMSVKGAVKLIDFGLCVDLSQGKRNELCGSPFWLAPEMIRRQPHDCKIDIWSLAICLLELTNGYPPNDSNSIKAMFIVATEGYPQPFENPNDWTEEMRNFFAKCLQFNPEQRGSAKELLESPWLKKASSQKTMKNILTEIFIQDTLDNAGFGGF